MFFASNRIADAVAVGLNAPRTALSRHQLRPATRRATRVLSLVVGVALAAAMVLPGLANAAPGDPFGVQTFSNQIVGTDGLPYTQAGGHPDRNATEFSVPFVGTGPLPFLTAELLSSSYVNPPLGFIGNPAAAPRCLFAKIKNASGGGDLSQCPLGSRVGTASVTINPDGTFGSPFLKWPLYNLIPERGYPAQFGFKFGVVPTVLSAFLLPRTKSYGLTVATPGIPAVNVSSAGAEFCSYGAEYNGAYSPGTCNAPSSAAAPFLSNPVDCSKADPTWSITIDSREHAGSLRSLGVPDLTDLDWKTATEPTPAVTGCEALLFNPSLAVKPLQGGGPVQADSPSGLAVDLDFPQNNDPTDLNTTFDPELPQTPAPKDITVKLPAGFSVSPSSADGLGACSDQASDPAGDQVHYDNTNPVSCPDSAKIGSATVLSPLLALHEPEDPNDKVLGPDPIGGDVYLLKPHPGDLPTSGGSQEGKFRLLLQFENPRYGVNIKIPGIATADKNTGQLSATFTENPQLPSSKVTVNLKTGPRAPLASPTSCGAFTADSDLVPWSTPYTPTAHPSSTFNVSSGPGGSACPASPAARPFAPTISAGTDSNAAGKYSPFTLRIDRADGEQELSTIDVTTPKGFSAKLAGVPYCSEAAIAAAGAKSGLAEQASPSCPAASQIGSVTAGAGPGTTPYYAQGKAYLAGPYKGAPLSFAFITPAVAGPFDLGTTVVRAAAFVDPETTRVTTKTDPLPQIIDGVPLRIRSIVAHLDRQNFTINPTNCQAMSVSAHIGSSNGAAADPSNPFQVGGCDKLGFKPKLKIALKGPTKRGKFPALKATLDYPTGAYANIATAQVTLPHSEFLEQGHIKTICTRVQFAANACPAASIYGKATASTPLLDAPLSGPVYLRSSSNKLPDLVADLNGQIHVALVGRIDSINGGIRTTFEGVPDAPVSKFTLEMLGGKKGLLVNSGNICKTDNRAIVAFDAQNGLSYDARPELTNGCKKSSKKSKGAKGKSHKRSAR
jgi:hypothetical protein